MLYDSGYIWAKRINDEFNIAMGKYDPAETHEIAGICND